MRNPIIPRPESAPFSLTQVSELGQEVGAQVAPARGLMDDAAGCLLNIHPLLSKNRDEATDNMLFLSRFIVVLNALGGTELH